MKLRNSKEWFLKSESYERDLISSAEQGEFVDFYIVTDPEELGIKIPEELPEYRGEIDDGEIWI